MTVSRPYRLDQQELGEHPTRSVPEGWSLAKLGEISTAPQYGWTTSAQKDAKGLKLLRTSDISDGVVDWDSVPTCRDEPSNIEKYLLRPGDIVVSRAGSVGLSYLVTETPRAIFASYLIRFRPIPPINRKFIALFLQSPDYWSAIAEEAAGITIPNVNASKLKQLDVLIPPLAEQKRIVAKIEQLLARVNAAGERLARVPTIVNRFRQAILAAACSGRLTEDWRHAHSGIEPATALVERVRQASGQDRRASLVTPELTDGEYLFDVPDSWVWISAGLAYVDARYGTSVKCLREMAGGAPVLRVPNIARAILDLADLKYARLSEREISTLTLHEGDILVCRTNGSLGLVGKAAVIPQLPRPHAFASYLIRLRLDQALVLPFYLHYLICSPFGRDQIEEKARSTAGQFNLNLEILSNLAVPVPPLQEQEEIIHRVEALFKLADAIEKRVSAATARAEKLTQAILARAFRGELVPTEAELARREGRNYEPASVVFERVMERRKNYNSLSGKVSNSGADEHSET